MPDTDKAEIVSGDQGISTDQLGIIPGGIPPGFPFPMPMMQQQAVQLWQSPYPPPDAMTVYEGLHSGAMDRILKLAEQGQSAQIDDVKESRRFTYNERRRGQALGALTTIIALGLAAFIADKSPVIAGLMLGVPVLAVAKALIDGHKQHPPPMPPA